MTEILILRLLHVGAGTFWVGTVLFTTFFLMPVLAAAGPGAGPIMAGLQRRRLFTVMPVVALVTLLSGLRLIWITSGGFAAGYLASGRGMALTGGGVTGLLAFLLGMLLIRPTAMRMGALGPALAAAPDDQARARITAEMERLRRRNRVGNLVVAWLLIITTAAMAVGRYLP